MDVRQKKRKWRESRARTMRKRSRGGRKRAADRKKRGKVTQMWTEEVKMKSM